MYSTAELLKWAERIEQFLMSESADISDQFKSEMSEEAIESIRNVIDHLAGD